MSNVVCQKNVDKYESTISHYVRFGHDFVRYGHKRNGFDSNRTDKWPLVCKGVFQIRRGINIMNTEMKNQPTIFLIEEDDETRRPLMQNLSRYGYRVIVALDEEDALERVGAGYIQADLMIINLVGKSVDELLNAGRNICKHAKYDGHTPLIVMPEKYNKDVEGTEVNTDGNDWIFYLGEEHDQLLNLLRRLLPSPSENIQEP